jgi:hypothetical protein
VCVGSVRVLLLVEGERFGVRSEGFGVEGFKLRVDGFGFRIWIVEFVDQV